MLWQDPNAAELRKAWANPYNRSEVIGRLSERGIDFNDLAEAADQPDADPFDLLCFISFNFLIPFARSGCAVCANITFQPLLKALANCYLRRSSISYRGNNDISPTQDPSRHLSAGTDLSIPWCITQDVPEVPD